MSFGWGIWCTSCGEALRRHGGVLARLSTSGSQRTHLRNQRAAARVASFGTVLTFEQNPLRGALEIVVLTALEGPHEGREAGQPEADRNRHKKEEIDHRRDP